MEKAYVTNFIYCDRITQEAQVPFGNRITLDSPFSELTLANIPGNYSFSVYFSVGGIKRGKKRIVFQLLDENEQVTGNIAEASIDENQFKNNDEMIIQMVLDVKNYVFKSEGVYTGRIMIDNNVIGNFPITVRKMI